MFGTTGRWHTFWVILALLSAGILAFVLYSFPGTFVFGLFLYYVSRPVYVRLRRWLRSQTLAAAAALFVLVLPVILRALPRTAPGRRAQPLRDDGNPASLW